MHNKSETGVIEGRQISSDAMARINFLIFELLFTACTLAKTVARYLTGSVGEKKEEDFS
jgi:hypothetical protein